MNESGAKLLLTFAGMALAVGGCVALTNRNEASKFQINPESTPTSTHTRKSESESFRGRVAITPTILDRPKPTMIPTQKVAITPTSTPWPPFQIEYVGRTHYNAPRGMGCNRQTEKMLNNGGMGEEAEQRKNRAYATTSHPDKPSIPGTVFKLVETCALNDGTGYILVEDERGVVRLVVTKENSNNPVHKAGETQCFSANTNDSLFGGQKEPGRSIAHKMGAQFGVCYQLTGGESGQVAIFNPPLIKSYPGAGWTPTRTPQAVRK